jgi:hypothetical protein
MTRILLALRALQAASLPKRCHLFVAREFAALGLLEAFERRHAMLLWHRKHTAACFDLLDSVFRDLRR